MVALDAAARAEGAARPAAQRTTNRWFVGTAAVLVVGSLAPLMVAPGIGHLSAAVMSLLLGGGVAAVGLALGSPRAAFGATLGLVLLLGFGRLPPRAAPGYEEPVALWQTDQTIEASLSGGGSGQAARIDDQASVSGGGSGQLAVFAEAVFAGQQAPFGVTATLNGQRLAWQCRFVQGRQWLELPLRESASVLDVTLGLSGTPDRERNYLVVYHSTTRDGYLVGLTEDPSVPAPVTTCTLA